MMMMKDLCELRSAISLFHAKYYKKINLGLKVPQHGKNGMNLLCLGESNSKACNIRLVTDFRLYSRLFLNTFSDL